MAAIDMAPQRREASTASFEQFEALFADELEELREIAIDRDVGLHEVSQAYFSIVRGDYPMQTHSDLQNALNADGPETWNIASVLVDFGEVYRSKGDDWWWVVASEFLAERCRMRTISLNKYVEMEEDLRAFQDDVVRYHHIRKMPGNLQDQQMRDIKVEHGRRIHEKYYPEKEFDEEEFHNLQVSRYIKTAQDVIMEALDLSY